MASVLVVVLVMLVVGGQCAVCMLGGLLLKAGMVDSII